MPCKCPHIYRAVKTFLIIPNKALTCMLILSHRFSKVNIVKRFTGITKRLSPFLLLDCEARRRQILFLLCFSSEKNFLKKCAAVFNFNWKMIKCSRRGTKNFLILLLSCSATLLYYFSIKIQDRPQVAFLKNFFQTK